MSRSRLLIGGGRSSGKTTLLNYLVSGTPTSPFPRGVHGRLSLGNSVNYIGIEGDVSSGDQPIVFRVSTSGPGKKEIEIRSNSIESSSLLFVTTHDLQHNILRAQNDDESTCLSLSIASNLVFSLTSITEIGAKTLETFSETGILFHPENTEQLEQPDIYVHLTSAIKPLAHIEREAILRFRSSNTPVILLVNKSDLADDANSLKEVEGLVSGFASNQCLPKYFCSFANNRDSTGGVLDLEAVAELIADAILHGTVEPKGGIASVDQERAFQEDIEISPSIAIPMLNFIERDPVIHAPNGFYEEAAKTWEELLTADEWRDICAKSTTTTLKKCLPVHDLIEEYDDDYNLSDEERTISVLFERKPASPLAFLIRIPEQPHIPEDIKHWGSRIKLGLVTANEAYVVFCYLRQYGFENHTTCTGEILGSDPSNLEACLTGNAILASPKNYANRGVDNEGDSYRDSSDETRPDWSLNSLSSRLDGYATANPIAHARKLIGNPSLSDDVIERLILSGQLMDYGISLESIDHYEFLMREGQD